MSQLETRFHGQLANTTGFVPERSRPGNLVSLISRADYIQGTVLLEEAHRNPLTQVHVNELILQSIGMHHHQVMCNGKLALQSAKQSLHFS